SLFIFHCSFFILHSSASGGQDVDSNKPYKVQLVLRIADHRQLTPLFKEKVEHELKDSLQAALGEMGSVSVVYDHPKLKEIEEKGLQVLDGWKELTGMKTHFVLIDLKDGAYEVRARQHDGYTGLASHLRKPERITDRQLVARTATLLVERDFGMVGAVKPIDAESARVRFLASGLEGSLEHWVKKGDVFSVVQVDDAGGKARASLVRWTLLQVKDDPKDGEAMCRLLRGESTPLSPAHNYRCLKLGTTRAPLQVRIMKANAPKPTPHQEILQIHVRRNSFKPDESFEQGITDDQGFFGTRKVEYDQVAFVSCLSSNVVRWQEPVPIFGDEPYYCFVSIRTSPAERLAFDRSTWEQMMYESDRMEAKLFEQLIKADPEKRQETLEKARKGLEALDADLNQFEAKRKELLNLKMDQTAGQSRLKDLRDKRDKLNLFIANQQEIIRAENDPKRKELLELIKQAQASEGEAEFGKALDFYKKILEVGIKDPQLENYAKHVKKLETAWAIKGPEHEAARKFIYETWPVLEPDGLKKGIPQAREALDACRKAGDKYSPQKLAKVALAHDGKLKQKKAELNPDANPDDVKAAQAIEAVLDDLAKLLVEVNEVLQQDMTPTK
ncbi:MAG TPA: hypothetical protein VGG61_02620, partial [Gemmataceae bacterium]